MRNPAEEAFIVSYLRAADKKYKQGADDGALKIVQYGYQNGYTLTEIAYALATAEHETAGWLQPIREGGTRVGPALTEQQALAAIRAAMAKGVIKQNYITPVQGQYYYGRGLVQITWIDNYRKYANLLGIPLVAQPDLALRWDVALRIMFDGIRYGRFRKVRLADYIPDGVAPTAKMFADARNVVNGDAKTVGPTLGANAMLYYRSLVQHDAALRAFYIHQTKQMPGWLAALLRFFQRG